jgi:hypothetical protein
MQITTYMAIRLVFLQVRNDYVAAWMASKYGRKEQETKISTLVYLLYH